MKEMEMNIKLASMLVDRVHRDNLPITIRTGSKLENDMIEVTIECEDHELYTRMLNEVVNKFVKRVANSEQRRHE